jgi:hypothetical protein
MKLKYEVWLNEQRDKEGHLVANIAGYEKHDPLVFAYEGAIEIGDRIGRSYACEEIFRMFNADHPSGYYNRSLSIGDVIYFTETTAMGYAVEGDSFKVIEPPQFDKMLIPTEHRTVREVLRDVVARLKHEGIQAGESDWSDMTRYDGDKLDYNYSAPWPMRARWIVAYPVTGSNEGYYLHLDSIYQASSLFGDDLAKAKAKDPNTFSLKEGRVDRRIVLGQAKTWDWDNAWQIAKRTAELLGV